MIFNPQTVKKALHQERNLGLRKGSTTLGSEKHLSQIHAHLQAQNVSRLETGFWWIQLFTTRSCCISGGPKSHGTGIFLLARGRTQMHWREGRGKMEAASLHRCTRVAAVSHRNARDCWKPPRRQEEFFPRCKSEHGSVDTLILEFQPPELWENKVLIVLRPPPVCGFLSWECEKMNVAP